MNVVEDEACPTCGAKWGGELDFPNRPKVAVYEVWWWKCYNPDCPTSYYNPETGETADD